MKIHEVLKSYKNNLICVLIGHETEQGNIFHEYIQAELIDCDEDFFHIQQYFPLLSYLEGGNYDTDNRDIPISSVIEFIHPKINLR